MIDLASLERYARRVDLVLVKPGRELFAGRHLSIVKGQGLTFAGYREYQYGDDIRDLDWNVTARLGKPFVKVFEQERGSTVLILLDLSASVSVGRRKGELARELAALFVLAAGRHDERMGALLFTDRLERCFPPRRSRCYGQLIVREVMRYKPAAKGTDLSAALREAARLMGSPGVVVIISDFLAEGYERPLRALAARHDVSGVALVDPTEASLPETGLARYSCPETGLSRWVDTSSVRVRQAYADWWRGQQKAREAQFANAGVSCVEIPVNQPYLPRLLRPSQRGRAPW